MDGIPAFYTQSFLYAHKLHFCGSTGFLLPLRAEGRPVCAADSFTCFRTVCSALCAHSDRIALFRIFPPDCPNKPEQTGRRQRGDVTHSSEPWRLSAWRRSGGLHGDVKQERSHSSIHLRGARNPENKPAPGLCRSFITLKQRDQITAQRTCRAAAVSRRRGRNAWYCYRILTLNDCCIPPHRLLWLLYVPVAETRFQSVHLLIFSLVSCWQFIMSSGLDKIMY